MKDAIQYNFISPDLPKEDMEEALSILESLNSRKADKVNWEERAQMDAISRKRSGIVSEESNDKKEPSKEMNEDKPQKNKKPENKKENDLLEYLGGVMNYLEGNDGKK